jgi:hypothetical protein
MRPRLPQHSRPCTANAVPRHSATHRKKFRCIPLCFIPGNNYRQSCSQEPQTSCCWYLYLEEIKTHPCQRIYASKHAYIVEVHPGGEPENVSGKEWWCYLRFGQHTSMTLRAPGPGHIQKRLPISAAVIAASQSLERTHKQHDHAAEITDQTACSGSTDSMAVTSPVRSL